MLPKPRERLSRHPQLPVVEVRAVEPQHARLLLEASAAAAFGLGGRGQPSKVRGICSSNLVNRGIPTAAVAEADFLVVREDIGGQDGFSGGVGRGARGQKADLALRVKVEGPAVEGEAPEKLEVNVTKASW